MLVAGVAWFGSTGNFSSATYAGQSLTQVANVASSPIAMWAGYRLNPSSGSDTMQFNMGTTVFYLSGGCYRVDGRNQVAPEASNSNTGSGTSSSINLSATGGAVCFDFLATYSSKPNHVPGANQTERFDQSGSSFIRISSSTEEPASTSTVTMSQSWSGSNTFCHIAMSFAAVAGEEFNETTSLSAAATTALSGALTLTELMSLSANVLAPVTGQLTAQTVLDLIGTGALPTQHDAALVAAATLSAEVTETLLTVLLAEVLATLEAQPHQPVTGTMIINGQANLASDSQTVMSGGTVVEVLATMVAEAQQTGASLTILDLVVALTAEIQHSPAGTAVMNTLLTLAANSSDGLQGQLDVEALLELSALAETVQVGGRALDLSLLLDAAAQESAGGPLQGFPTISLDGIASVPLAAQLIAGGLLALNANAEQSPLGTATKNALATLTTDALLAVLDFIGEIDGTLALEVNTTLSPSAISTMNALSTFIGQAVQGSAGTMVVDTGTALQADTAATFLSGVEVSKLVELAAVGALTPGVLHQLESALTLTVHATVLNQSQLVIESMINLGVAATVAHAAGAVFAELVALGVAMELQTTGQTVSGTMGRVLKRVGETLKHSSLSGEVLKQSSRTGETLAVPTRTNETLEADT